MRAAVATFGLALGLAGPATAAPQDLLGRIDTLRRDAGTLGVELAQAEPADRSRFASFETRLLRIEEELRRLTGRLEELEHRQRQFEARLGGASVAGSAGAAGEPQPVAGATGEAEPPAEPSGAAAAAPEASGLPATASPVDGDGTPPAAAAPVTPNLQAALTGTADERYRAALDLLEAGEFDAAEIAFSRFVEDFPNDPRAPTAAFWLGETHFFRQDYATAASVYARNYRKYGPDAPRAPDTLLKLGMSLAAMGDKERACQTFEELATRHPDAPAPIRQMLRRERTAAGCG